jgi:hypothetical protein
MELNFPVTRLHHQYALPVSHFSALAHVYLLGEQLLLVNSMHSASVPAPLCRIYETYWFITNILIVSRTFFFFERLLAYAYAYDFKIWWRSWKMALPQYLQEDLKLHNVHVGYLIVATVLRVFKGKEADQWWTRAAVRKASRPPIPIRAYLNKIRKVNF